MASRWSLARRTRVGKKHLELGKTVSRKDIFASRSLGHIAIQLVLKSLRQRRSNSWNILKFNMECPSFSGARSVCLFKACVFSQDECQVDSVAWTFEQTSGFYKDFWSAVGTAVTCFDQIEMQEIQRHAEAHPRYQNFYLAYKVPAMRSQLTGQLDFKLEGRVMSQKLNDFD